MNHPHLLPSCFRHCDGVRVLVCASALWLAACAVQESPVSIITPRPAPPPTAPTTPTVQSQARTVAEYRTEAAQHLYTRNRERIYQGKLPPHLYAVGVMHIGLNARGEVTSLEWVRAPQHAPEVMSEIERSVRAAAPFPRPQHLQQVSYTETWLWHHSGRFQLHTLSEGQL